MFAGTGTSKEATAERRSTRYEAKTNVKKPLLKGKKRTSPKASKSTCSVDTATLIADNGAFSIKVGRVQDEEADIVPNCIMKAKSEKKRLFIGNQIKECRDCAGLYYLLPCEKGYITKWDVQKPVWDNVFGKNAFHLSEHPLVMTQPIFNFKSIQDCIDEIFFEEYEISSMLRLNPTDLAWYKYVDDNNLSQDTPILIVDSGYSFTHIVPYINGSKYIPAMKRLNVGGKLLTNHLKDIISYRQYNVMEETYVINQVKEDTCYVANNVLTELKASHKPDNSIVKNYVLPDFNNIRRGYVEDETMKDQRAEGCQILRLSNERFTVPEILFHPSDIGMRSIGIIEAIVKSIFLCPQRYRSSLSKHILFIGGNCMFPGFKERVYNELRSHLPQSWTLNVEIPKDTISYTWSAGKSIVKYPEFQTLLVSKEEYEEVGSTVVQEKYNHWCKNLAEEDEPPKKRKFEVCLLDSLKGKAVFGKGDASEQPNSKPSSKTSSPSTSTSKEESSKSSTKKSDKKSTKEEESSSMADSISTTSDEASEVSDSETPEPQPRSRSLSKSGSPKNANIEAISDSLQVVDIFPFGKKTYL